VAVIQSYVQAHDFSEQRDAIRLDGQYGTMAVVADLEGLSYVMRGQDFDCLTGLRSRPACTCLPISSSASRKVVSNAHSTTAQTCLSCYRGSRAVSSSLPILHLRRRVGLVSPVLASSTSCS
jgi:hypothetical protein